MKSIKLAYIKDLEKMNFHDFSLQMELHAAKALVGENNWEKDFPYQPGCLVSIARCDYGIALLYSVRGMDLRCENLEDNMNIWEDSCCEFFVLNEKSGEYHNFEINAIAKLLAAKGKDRHNRTKATKEELAKVLRFTSLEEKKWNVENEICSYQVGMIIPFSLIGLDQEAKAAQETCSEAKSSCRKIRANIYKCGDKTAHVHFLSWNPIATENPDFHRPEFFGELIF